MMSKKEYFYFDKDTFSYKKEKKNLIFYLRTYWILILATGFFTFFFIYLFIQFYEGDAENKVLLENYQLAQQISENQVALAEFQTALDSLSEKNKVVYKMILDADYEEDTTRADQDELKDDSSWEDIENEIKKLKEKIADQTNNQSMMYQLATVKKGELRKVPAIRPIKSEIISGFGKKKHPIHKTESQHNGIDFKADVGTEVVATGDGYVAEIGNKNSGNGLYVVINHGFGYTSKYSHLSKVNVPRFAQVKRGQIIALTGKSGLVKGPHLHYEVHKNYKPVNPLDYFFSDITTDEYLKIKKQTEVVNESMD